MQARQANRQAGREEGSRHRLRRWQTGRQTRIGRWQTDRETNKQNRQVADKQAE